MPQELGFKVVLTGEGADEVFTGYPLFLSDVLREPDLSWTPRIPEDKRRTLLQTADIEAAKRYDCLDPEGTKQPFMPSPVFAGRVSKMNPLCAEDVIANDVTPAVIKQMQENWHPIDTAQYVWTKGHLPNQFMSCLGDRTEMAHSIEGRLPFLDDSLTEYIYNIPPSIRMKWDGKESFTEKYVLREAMRPFVTTEVYERGKHVSPRITSSPLTVSNIHFDLWPGAKLTKMCSRTQDQ